MNPATPIDRTLASPLPAAGFQIVDLLNEDELAWTRHSVRQLGYAQANADTFRISINQEPTERKQAIQATFIPKFQSAFDRHISDYRLMRVALFDKLPGGASVRLHQHPQIVDESQFRSLAVWLPLVDTTFDMGTLHIIPYSHDIFVHKTRTHNDYTAFAGVSGKLARELSTPVILKAGQGIIFDDRLLHWSPRNRSNVIRTAFQLEFIPTSAPHQLTVYYRDNSREISQYLMSQSLYREGALTLQKSKRLEHKNILKERYRNYGDHQLRRMMAGYDPDHANVRRSWIANRFNRWVEPLD